MAWLVRCSVANPNPLELGPMKKPEYDISIQAGYVLVEDPPNYVVVREDIPAKLAAISGKCSEAGVNKVLVRTESANIRLGVTGLFYTGVDIATSRLKVAFVVTSHDATVDDEAFMETVVCNRGGSVQFFQSESEAIDWLDVADAQSSKSES